MTGLPALSHDRAARVLLGQAAGDTLDARYEFTTFPAGIGITLKGGGRST